MSILSVAVNWLVRNSDPAPEVVSGPVDLWSLVNPFDAGDFPQWYLGFDWDSGMNMMFWTYNGINPAMLPNFVCFDWLAYAFITPHREVSEDTPDFLSDDPNTPAPAVGPGPCPF